MSIGVCACVSAQVSPAGPERRDTQHPLRDLPCTTAQREQHGLQ